MTPVRVSALAAAVCVLVVSVTVNGYMRVFERLVVRLVQIEEIVILKTAASK